MFTNWSLERGAHKDKTTNGSLQMGVYTWKYLHRMPPPNALRPRPCPHPRAPLPTPHAPYSMSFTHLSIPSQISSFCDSSLAHSVRQSLSQSFNVPILQYHPISSCLIQQREAAIVGKVVPFLPIFWEKYQEQSSWKVIFWTQLVTYGWLEELIGYISEEGRKEGRKEG